MKKSACLIFLDQNLIVKNYYESIISYANYLIRRYIYEFHDGSTIFVYISIER